MGLRKNLHSARITCIFASQIFTKISRNHRITRFIMPRRHPPPSAPTIIEAEAPCVLHGFGARDDATVREPGCSSGTHLVSAIYFFYVQFCLRSLTLCLPAKMQRRGGSGGVGSEEGGEKDVGGCGEEEDMKARARLQQRHSPGECDLIFLRPILPAIAHTLPPSQNAATRRQWRCW